MILDLMLPDMSGEELCLTLKEITQAPIITLTAKARVAGFAPGAKQLLGPTKGVAAQVKGRLLSWRSAIPLPTGSCFPLHGSTISRDLHVRQLVQILPSPAHR